MVSTNQSIEQEIQAKGLTAPRVTPADIEAAIETEHYFTAADGVYGWRVENGGGPDWCGEPLDSPLRLLTFCVLVLRNGFIVTGESACASPKNFDADLGKKIARCNAEAKIWPLLGYELRSKLAAVPLHEPAQTRKYTREDIQMMRTAYCHEHRDDVVQAVLRDGTHVEIDLRGNSHRTLQTEAEVVEAVLAKANGVTS